MTRTDAAETHADALIAADWTAAHNLANSLNPAQIQMLRSSLIAAHVGGSAWALNQKENARLPRTQGHEAQIREAHTWLRHGEGMFGFCRCGKTKPLLTSEHAAHVDGMIREAAELRADRIADRLMDDYANATDRPDDLQTVRGLLADAALAALTETEDAR